MSILSSDRPSIDPKDDLFGHAPFAAQLAQSIKRNRNEDGLVLALHGPWGSGKTTVLGYVCHFLENGDQPAEAKPVTVHFNPWWFSGRDDLAQAFLRQLQAVLPAKNKKFEKLGSLLGDFAESVGGLIDLTGVTGGVAGTIGKLLGQVLKKKPKDVPALKSEISKILREARIRILVIIDDIDRLDEGEVRQLFTVIKALADFPFVTYLLAFDREVASRAIERDSGLPGDRYLEKIIQVPFELPPVDKVALRAALFKRLDEVMSATPEGMFDQSYWTNVYFDGIDPLIRVPRDIVRFTNTLSVTYPAVVGEVNPVDFIAIEALRVFLPSLYDTIRSNQDEFAGASRDDRHGGNRAARIFQGVGQQAPEWLSQVPEEWHSSVSALLERLFPKIGNTIYSHEWLGEWRRDVRVCHPDLFPLYFRLSLPLGSISRREMKELIGLVGTPDAFKDALARAKSEKRPDGLSKVRALLERLMDHIQSEIPEEQIPTMVESLLDVGDDLIDPDDERGMFDFGNVSRVTRPAYHLLKRKDRAERPLVLETAIRSGHALAVQCRLLSALEEEITKSKESGAETLVDPDGLDALKTAWVERVRALSNDQEFVSRPELPRILAGWRLWGSDAEPRTWCEKATSSDEGLLRLLKQCLHHTKSNAVGDWAVRVSPRLNPTWLESYLDTQVCYERVSDMRRRGAIPDWASESAGQYIKEYEMLARGENPDAIGAFDDKENK